MKNASKFWLTSVVAGMATSPLAAQEAMGIDEKINQAFASITGPFVSLIFAPFPGTSFPWIVMWLVVVATIFTLYFGFVQFRFLKHAVQLSNCSKVTTPIQTTQVRSATFKRLPRLCPERLVWVTLPGLRSPSGLAGRGLRSG